MPVAALLQRAKDAMTRERVIVALTALLALAGLMNPDKVPVGDGFGWDGVLYGELAKTPRQAFSASLSDFYVGRMAPSLAIHCALRAFSMSLTGRNVLLAFGVLNVVLLTASAWLWTRIARRLRIGARGLWLGFLAAFVNFFVLKNTSYYPALTDVAAYFLAWAMLASYLRGSTLLLLATLTVGRFTWPTALPLGAPLLLFPLSAFAGAGAPPAAASGVVWRAWVLAALPTLGLAAFVVWAMKMHDPVIARILPNCAGIFGPFMPAWPLSLACACALLLIGLFLVLRESPATLSLRTYLAPLGRWSFYAKLLFVVVLAFATRPFAAPDLRAPLTVADWLQLSAWYSIVTPFKSLVSHGVYFGPVVVLAVLGWRRIARVIGESGPAPSLVIALALILALDSESRHLVYAFPFLVVFVAKAVDAQAPSGRTLGMFAAVSLLTSKVWLVIGADLQLYGANMGPWMSHTMYIVHGLVWLAVAAWCARSRLVPS